MDSSALTNHASPQRSTAIAHTSDLPRFARNIRGRDFAVGDIHGCFTLLDEALKAIGFNERIDRLFSLGDLVDRGPDSDQVLAWLDRPWFHAICGNHDFLIWRAALGIPYSQVDYRIHGGLWIDQLSGAERVRIGERLAALPLAVEIETAHGIVGMVHADSPFDDWRDMQRVRWDDLDPASSVSDCCLWSIERYTRKYEGHVQNVRAVVHGHMMVSSAEVLGNVHFIDSCGWRPGGHFTFLDLDSLETIKGPVNASAEPSRRNR